LAEREVDPVPIGIWGSPEAISSNGATKGGGADAAEKVLGKKQGDNDPIGKPKLKEQVEPALFLSRNAGTGSLSHLGQRDRFIVPLLISYSSKELNTFSPRAFNFLPKRI